MPVASKKRRPPAKGAPADARPKVAGKPAEPAPPAPSTSRIIDAAVHLFATHGYASSTLEEVAAMAGFTKGAVYYYFKSKEMLLIEVLRAIEARSIDATILAVQAHGGTPSEQLDHFVRCQTRWAARHPEDLAIVMLMSIETARTQSKVKTQMLKMYGKLGKILESIIEAGKKAGEFAAQDTKDTVLYLQAVHDGNMMIWYRSGTDPEIGRKLTRATLSGFAHAVRRP